MMLAPVEAFVQSQMHNVSQSSLTDELYAHQLSSPAAPGPLGLGPPACLAMMIWSYDLVV